MTADVAVGSASPALRADARDNRDRILTAARAAFASEGLGVGLAEIARRAGVGNATVHRHFTKDELLEETFGPWHQARLAMADQALADPDPWHGFTSFVEDLLVTGDNNCAARGLFTVRPQWRAEIGARIAALLTRAQAQGQARADLSITDVLCALLGVFRTMAITSSEAPQQWRRHLQITLDGMRSDTGPRLPGLALTPEQMSGCLDVVRDRMARGLAL